MPYSYNGWLASPNPKDFGGLAKLTVAGEEFAPGVRAGDVHTVLQYVANQLHRRVEPVVKAGWHQADDWGYAYRANRNNPNNLSCHASGTAIDYNATRHPNGKRGTFSAAQVAEIRRILAEVNNVVRWGGDFSGTKDEMHFEISGNAAAVRAAAQKVRGKAVTVAAPVQRGEGIDVYERYQRVTNWNAVRNAGKRFVYIKVSDGTSSRSDAGYARGAKAAGIYAGGYHYAQFGDPVRQANLLVDRCLATGATDLAPCLDLESPFSANAHAADFAIRFLRQIKARGFRPCIYANNSMMSYVGPRVKAAVPDTYLWVARYAGNTSTAKLRPTAAWDLHQYSQYGLVSGIAGRVDLNDGIIPLNKTGGGGGAAAPARLTIADLYGDQMIRVPKGGSSKHNATFPLPVSVDREHNLCIAPGNRAVVVRELYYWSMKNNAGLGHNPVSGAKEEVVWEKQGRNFIVPKGTAKIDLQYWADDDFTVSVVPRG